MKCEHCKKDLGAVFYTFTEHDTNGDLYKEKLIHVFCSTVCYTKNILEKYGGDIAEDDVAYEQHIEEEPIPASVNVDDAPDVEGIPDLTVVEEDEGFFDGIEKDLPPVEDVESQEHIATPVEPKLRMM